MDRSEIIKLLLENRPKPLVSFFELIKTLHRQNLEFALEARKLQNGLAVASQKEERRVSSIYA